MTLHSQDQLVFCKEAKVQELLLPSLSCFSSLTPVMSGGSSGAWMLAWAQGQFCFFEGFRTNLLAQVFPGHPTKTCSFSVSGSTAALAELPQGLNRHLGVGLAAWQSHTRNTLLHSSAWCALPHSSGLSRNVCLWNLLDPPRQRDHLFFLVSAVLWTVLYFLYMLHCIYIAYFYHSLLCYSVNF